MQVDWEEVAATVDPTGTDPTVDPTTTAQEGGGLPGIYEVHSSAPGNGLDGTPYKSW